MNDNFIVSYVRNIESGKQKFNWEIILKLLIPALLGIIAPFVFYVLLKTNENIIFAHIGSWTSFCLLVYSIWIMFRFELLGKFGQSILLLVPTLVWLVPEYNEVLVWTIISAAIGLTLFFILSFLGWYMAKNKKDIIATSLILNISFLIMGISVIFIFAIIIIQWGEEGMGWLGDPFKPDIKDTSRKSWVIYILATSTFIIFLMIVESMFRDTKILKYQKINEATRSINLTNLKEFRKENYEEWKKSQQKMINDINKK